MTGKERTMKRYCNAVERRLNLPRDIRTRVMTDFGTTITALREAGKTDGEIYAQLGTPKQAAAELNEQMKDFAYRKSPWRFAGAAVAVISGILLGFLAGVNLLGKLLTQGLESANVGIIGGADGPTAIFVTQRAGINWEYVLLAGALAAGLVLFWRLSRCKPKKS